MKLILYRNLTLILFFILNFILINLLWFWLNKYLFYLENKTNNKKYEKIINEIKNSDITEIEILASLWYYFWYLINIWFDWIYTFKQFDIKDCNKKITCFITQKNWYIVEIWFFKNTIYWFYWIDYIFISLLLSFLSTILFFLFTKKIFHELESSFKYNNKLAQILWHEIKTPLTNLYLLINHFLISKNNNLIDKIENEIKKIDKTINSILDIAYIKKWNKLINIKDIILEYTNNEIFILNLKDTIIKADENHIRWIIKNLIENAMKHWEWKIYIELKNKKLIIKNKIKKSQSSWLWHIIINEICKLYGWNFKTIENEYYTSIIKF